MMGEESSHPDAELLDMESFVNGLGEVDEDEKVCCDCKCCCTKKRGCYFVVFSIIFIDVYFWSQTVLFLIGSVDLIDETEPDSQYLARRFIIRIIFSFWATYLSQFCKLYCAIKWLREPSRNNFLALYRISVTYCYSALSGLSLYFILRMNPGDIAGLVNTILNTAFIVVELILL